MFASFPLTGIFTAGKIKEKGLRPIIKEEHHGDDSMPGSY